MKVPAIGINNVEYSLLGYFLFALLISDCGQEALRTTTN